MSKQEKDRRLLTLFPSEQLESAPSKPTSELEAMTRRLEDRIGQLEGEIGSLRSQLSGQAELLAAASSKTDVQNLSDLIEQKILKVADELYPEQKRQESASARFIHQQLQKLAHIVTMDGFKHLLLSVWYGGRPGSGEVDDFGMDVEFAKRVKPFFDFIYYTYWRVQVQGAHHLPDEGRGLVVSNHSGTLPYDGCMIRLASENEHPRHRDIRFLVEDFVYHFPFLGTFMYRTGGVRACPENATRLLESDHLVAVFPEGVKGIGKLFKNRYRLQRFGRGGFIKLALKTGSPIIPTAVIGAEEIHPMLHKSTIMAKALGVPYIPITPTFPLMGPAGLVPLPTKWNIIFGEPMKWKQYGPKHAEDPLLVNRLSEEVRARIQKMIREGLAKRRSVWFG